MFHVKYETNEKCPSVLSPPPGENTRGGGTSGILRHEHIKRVWCYLLLTVAEEDEEAMFKLAAR